LAFLVSKYLEQSLLLSDFPNWVSLLEEALDIIFKDIFTVGHHPTCESRDDD